MHRVRNHFSNYCGLFTTESKAVPLSNVHVESTVVNFCCQVTLTQTFLTKKEVAVSSDPLRASSNQDGEPVPCNHRLKSFVTPSKDYICDVCDKQQVMGTGMHGCRICNWDECSSCYNGSITFKNRVGDKVCIDVLNKKCMVNDKTTENISSLTIYKNQNGGGAKVQDTSGWTRDIPTTKVERLKKICTKSGVKFVEEKVKPMVDCIYYFPLEGGASVYEFYAVMQDGTKVSAVCKDKFDAKREFEVAKQKGDTAFLMEREQMDIFKFSLGNIPAGEEITITLSYCSELTQDGDFVRLRIPNRIAPKYQDRRAPYEDSIPSTCVNYPLRFDLKLECSSPITNVKCLGKQKMVQVLEPGNNQLMRAHIAQKGGLNEDLVVLIGQEKLYGCHCVLEQNEQLQSECLKLTWNTKQQNNSTMSGSKEIIFLIDTSGSMSGSRMNMVKEMLVLFLHSLPVDCKFNLIEFDSSYEKLYDASVVYDELTMKKAKDWASKLRASGGTEIYQPLENVLSSKEVEGHPRCVILLTDGEVSSTNQVLKLAGQHETQIFTLGVGESFSQELVEGLANVTGGQWLAVKDSADISDKCIRLLRYCLAPSLVDLDIDLGPWKSNSITQFPQKVPNLITGKRSSIYFIKDLKGEPQELPPFKVRFKGKYDNQDTLDLSIPVCLNVDAEGVSKEQQDRFRKSKTKLLHRIAAISRVKYLESQQKKKVDNRRGKEIRELGIKYNIATSKTSFIAVRENSEGVRMSIKAQKFEASSNNRHYEQMPRARFLCQQMSSTKSWGRPSHSTHSMPIAYGASSRSRGLKQPLACSASSSSSLLGNLVGSFRSLKSAASGFSLNSATKSLPKMKTNRCRSSQRHSFGGVAATFSANEESIKRQSSSLSSAAPPSQPKYQKKSRRIPRRGGAYSRKEESSNNGSLTSPFGKKRTMKWLVGKQNFNGSFKIDVEDSDFDFLRNGIQKLQTKFKDPVLIATVVALVFFHRKFMDTQQQWSLIEDKAKVWLRKQTNESFEDLMKMF